MNDKSASVGSASAFGMGATVIPSSRGQLKPIKINRGETERIRQLFGADRFEVLEAIAYNTKYPLYISAPHSGGSCSGLLITDDGLVNVSFVGEPDDVKLNNLDMQFYSGKGNGKTTAFSATFNSFLIHSVESEKIPNVSILIDDLPTKAEVTVESGKFILTSDIGEGEISIVDKVATVQFVFTDAPEDKKLVSFRVSTDVTTLEKEVYGLIGMRYPCEDFLAGAVYKSENDNNLILDLKQKRKGIYSQMTGYPTEFSLVKGTKNGSGLLIYGPELLKSDDNIFLVANENATLVTEAFKGSTVAVDFKGGYRGVKVTSSMLVEAWGQFKDTKKYPVEIYFDTTADESVPIEMASIRDGFAKFKTFLFPQPIVTETEMLASLPLKVSNRGLKTFWGAAYILNPYEPTGNLISTLMGEVASKYADALTKSYGGRAVAWSDENGVGGQLSMGRIVEFVYNCSEEGSKSMDSGRVNPIGANDVFGPIVMSRRSTDKSSGNYSYADYSGIVDYCIERIYKEVLPFQLIKFNDDAHRAIVRSKCESILKPLLAPPNNVIRDYAIKCDSSNNSDEVLSREEFVLSVAIKVTPKAEKIIFNFINSSQGGSVEEDVQ
ncbi:MAG: hypothetical protein ACRCZB_05005 [Bacteroidales bacterium]